MAIERGLAGFENGDYTELSLSTGAGTSSLNVLTAAARTTGTPLHSVYGLRLAPATSQQRNAALPVGAIMGTSGTVSSGNNKRGRCRTFLRVNTRPNGSSPNEERIFGFGSFNGTAVMWLDASGHYGLNVFGGSVSWSSPTLTNGTWYQVILDVLLAVSANTQITAVLTVLSEDGNTTIGTLTLGPTALGSSTDALNGITFGDTGGDHASAYSIDIDDVVWAASSNSDAASALTLPTPTAIFPILVTGASLNQWETGSVSNLDEIPVDRTSGTGDTLSSAKGIGTEVDLEFQSIGIGVSDLLIGRIVGLKIFCIAGQTAGVGTVNALFNSVTATLSLGASMASGVNMIAYQSWDPSVLLSESAWNSATLNVTKQTSSAVTTFISGVSAEALAEAFPDADASGGLTPNTGPTTGGTTVTITGVGFRANTQVTFDDVGATVVSRTDTTIICTTPPHAAGTVDVHVVTPRDTATAPFSTTLVQAFTFVAAGPGFITLNAARRDPAITVQNTMGNGQNTFSFSVNGDDAAPFAACASIDAQLGTGATIARGVILQTSRTVEDSRENERLDCSGSDNTWVMNGKLVAGTWTNVSASTVVVAILNKFAPDFSSAGVELSLPNISVAFFRDVNVGQALDKIVTLIPDGHWHLDTDNVVHFVSGSDAALPAPDDLTDTNADLRLAEYPITVKVDASQIRNRVYVRGSGSSTSTGYLAPVALPQADPGAAAPWFWVTDGLWGSLLETGGNIDTNRNTAGLTWYWLASYIFVWETANGNSQGAWTSRYPAPSPVSGSSYTTGSNQIGWGAGFEYANYDQRITGLKIYRELQRAGPHALNAGAYGNTDLYTPHQDSGHGPFFLVTTIAVADLPRGSELHYLDVASEDTLVGGEMKLFSELIGQDHTANIFAMEEDTDAQADLAALLGYGDGVREYLINDASITTESDASARATAELELWANPITTIVYATTDAKTKVGATVHVNLSHPVITGDFKIQQVSMAHIHDDDLTLPVLVATASSVRFTLDDLLARVLLSGDAGGSQSLANTTSAAGTPSGTATSALKLTPGHNINGVLFDGSADVSVTAAMDHMNETPTGTINGSNAVFTTAAAYKAGTLAVYLNGLRQKKTTDYGETTSTTFTLTTAPTSGDTLCVDYEEK